MGLREGFTALATQLQEDTKWLVKKRDVRNYKTVDVSFAVVHAILEALNAEFSHLEPRSNPLD